MADDYQYTKEFDPAQDQDSVPVTGGPGMVGADRRDGRGYVYNKDITLAVNLALATGRPLLVSGPPGSGKSSLAASVARLLDRRYLDKVITSRTQARDLQWRFDTLRRLNDATLGRFQRDLQAQADAGAAAVASSSKTERDDLKYYIEPGVFWSAFDPSSAAQFGAGPTQAVDTRPAVILLDEIDKADPDVPNDLLVALGSRRFEVEEIALEVDLPPADKPPLLIITTNGERELPKAFLRRCLILELAHPDAQRLVEIARKQLARDYPNPTSEQLDLYKDLAALVDKRLPDGKPDPERASTAEYLDALRACLKLGVRPQVDDRTWQVLEQTTLLKQVKPAGTS